MEPATKRPRVAFAVPTKRRRTDATQTFCGFQPAEDEQCEEPAATCQQVSASLPVELEKFITSSATFEQYRASIKGQHGPLLSQYRSVISCERGLSEGPERGVQGLGLCRVAQSVELLVQLADMRLDQLSGSQVAKETELQAVARELFEELCSAVSELQHKVPGIASTPPELYADELRRRWGAAGSGEGGSNGSSWAAQAAAMFRMKDVICSLYAWSLLPHKVLSELLSAVRGAAENSAKTSIRVVDPAAGTGLHGLLLEAAGAEVVLADAATGGNTQSGGAQCVSLGPAPRAGARGQCLESSAARPEALQWMAAERRDVLEESEEATCWWQQVCSRNTGAEPVLFLSFPPPPPSTVAEVAVRRFDGDWLIFCGEWRGCTGSAAFFDELDCSWDVCKEMTLPRWPMMDDKAVLLRRRPKQPLPAAQDDKSRFREVANAQGASADESVAGEHWLVDEARNISVFVMHKPKSTPEGLRALQDVAPGATGTVLWGAARVLIDYLRRIDDGVLRQARSVLELGAGCYGLVGAYLRQRLRAGTVVQTDLRHVLPKLRESVCANAVLLDGVRLEEVLDKGDQAATVSVCLEGDPACQRPQAQAAPSVGSVVTALPWEEPPSWEVRSHGPYDILVASDVAFCSRLVPHLFKTLDWLSSSRSVAIIAIVDRPGEAARFETVAREANWRYERCLTHDLDVSRGFQGSKGEEALLAACRDLGGYRIIVYELRKIA
eukprot:TRINITY_DN11220_c1_g1_i1.p1 TRINITY_DN11220_c1_g1~~TRINITY_DN11220_c1_g1_i1.p1  ORF type:complete len:725 (-),score=125.99 TRINITY_DN11220_c1_g1_i1:5-2179(-)